MADNVGSSTSSYGASNFRRQGFSSRIDFAGDRDWFRIPLQNRSRYTIDVKRKGGSKGLTDPYVTIRDANGNALVSDDDGGPVGLDARLTNYIPPSNGYFFIDVSGLGNSIGDYTVIVKETPAPGDAPSGPDTSYRVNVGGSVNGEIANIADNDWWKVRLVKNQYYNFNLTRTSGNVDPVLYLRDPSEKLVAQDDDGAGYPNSRISNFRATKTGDYYLVAVSFAASSSGGYNLSASLA